MSFHEKSAWACFSSTLAIWGAYLALVLARTPEPSGIALPAVIGAVVLQVIVMIAAHLAFAAVDRDPTFDERDSAIATRSANWAGWMLSLGVFACIVLFPLREIALHTDPPGRLATGALASPFATAHVLLLWMVQSELVHYGTQIVLYRRG